MSPTKSVVALDWGREGVNGGFLTATRRLGLEERSWAYPVLATAQSSVVVIVFLLGHRYDALVAEGLEQLVGLLRNLVDRSDDRGDRPDDSCNSKEYLKTLVHLVWVHLRASFWKSYWDAELLTRWYSPRNTIITYYKLKINRNSRVFSI